MIISHKHKYLFIEVPHTGSTAIANELVENYQGEHILHKHATYTEFKQAASEEELNYFVFASVRNPLDIQVSYYHKFVSNHKGNFTNPKMLVENGGHVSATHLEIYHYIQNNDASFQHYFSRYRNKVFNNFHLQGHSYFDFTIRFENLVKDFNKALQLAGITPVRDLPQANKTSGREGSFWDYYSSEIQAQAVRNYGPFLEKWHYQFPDSWNIQKTPLLNKFRFITVDWAGELLGKLNIHSNSRSPFVTVPRRAIKKIWG